MLSSTPIGIRLVSTLRFGLKTFKKEDGFLTESIYSAYFRKRCNSYKVSSENVCVALPRVVTVCYNYWWRRHSSASTEMATNKRLPQTFSSSEEHPAKPPNILIYSEKQEFEKYKTALQSLLKSEKFVIYPLTDQLIQSSPWIDNTELLVISHPSIPLEIVEYLRKYIEEGGNVFGIATDAVEYFLDFLKFERSETRQIVTCNYNGNSNEMVLGKIRCTNACEELEYPSIPLSVIAKDTHHPLIIKTKGHYSGNVLFSLIHLEEEVTSKSFPDKEAQCLKSADAFRLELLRDILDHHFGYECTSAPSPVLTPGYLLGNKKEMDGFLAQIEPCLKEDRFLSRGGLTLEFSKADAFRCVTETHLPIVTDASLPENMSFDCELYLSSLATSTMGKVVLYVDVLPTTMKVTQTLRGHPGVVVIAGRQTQGRGRGGNVWLSPRGCALFSFCFVCDVSSNLGRRPSFLQHLMALAFVEAIRTKQGYQDVDINLKWPNDIYLGRRVKIGGLVVTSTIHQTRLQCILGMGVNVTNTHPTACLSTAVEEYNERCGANLPSISVEEAIASTMTMFEKLVENYQTEGPRRAIDAYLNRWLHRDSEVKIQEQQGTILGLDEYGFLLVRVGQQVVSVQPDGNSFDMLHNLITVKQQ